MKNKGGTNHFFIAFGIVAIGLSAFVGLFSSVAYLGVLAGIFLIYAAFPEKTPEKAEETIGTAVTETSIGLRLDLD